ncbi:MAG: response regulator, partial [Ruminococcus sp.]|nr:response regulator [Ruminococcus sp.]
ESVYGEGSTFSFRLKQGIVSAEPMGDYEKRIAAAAENERHGEYLYAPEARVLVVDDNSMNLKVAVNLLSLYGIKADTADSGERALQMIKQNGYDVIFLDHMMPKMDGIEVMREIKALGLVPETTAVIALTANAIMGAKDMYLSEGFDDYLTKPIESRALEKQLRRSLPESKKQYRTPAAAKKREHSQPDSDSFTPDEMMELHRLCPALNVTAGLCNCMGSREFWLDTIKGFVEADKSGELDKAYRDGELELYRITVHSVKSAAKTIGADVLSELAKMLEFAARDNDNGYISSHHEEFIKEYKKLNNDVGKVLKL